MSLSRIERFRLKSRLVEEMNRDHLKWNIRRQNLLLTEFGFPALEQKYDSLTFDETIANISDSNLIAIYEEITGEDSEEFRYAAAEDDPGNWKPGYVRLFISHSDAKKDFVGEVANELAVVGIHGFVAPHTMAYNQPWQDQIEQALWSMQAFVSIVHPEFKDSAWCHQEVGWALGRRVHRYAVRMGIDPGGFIEREQWPSKPDASPKEVAEIISDWVSAIPELGEAMSDGLFTSLEAAGDYVSAGAAARRISALGSLNNDQWNRLDKIYWENDQVRNGVLPTSELEPFYQRQNRAWPPPKTDSKKSLF